MSNARTSPKHAFRALAGGVVLVLASACTGTIGGTGSNPIGPGGGGGSGPDGPGNGNGPGIGPDGMPLPLCDADQEQPGPRLVRLLTRDEYANTIRDLFGIARPDVSNLPVEPRVNGFDNNARSVVVTSRHVDEYLASAGRAVDTAISTRRAQILTCDPASPSCARAFVADIGKKAFRRPLTETELTRYTALFASDLTEGSFDEGMRLALTAMLSSSSFLYRSEVGQATADGRFQLDGYEVASALSYLYWGTMPDAALFEAAEAGELGDEAGVRAQAERLLTDPRSRSRVASFFDQWLRTTALLQVNKDQDIYPEFTDAVREAMAREQEMFVNYVVFEGGGNFEELFTAEFTFLNATLASFYGLDVTVGAAFERVSLAGNDTRGGLLTMGSLLASHAHSNESSPIKRGLFLRDRILCQTLPEPPLNVDTTPPGLDPTLTTRERFAAHTDDPLCQQCHQYIDSVGFGFEGYDGVGGYRSMENGLPIDTTGHVRGLNALRSDTVDHFDGLRDLSAVVADSYAAQACIATQYYRYARGIRETTDDHCAIQRLQAKFRDQQLSVRDLLIEVVTQPSFLLRRGDA